MYKGTLENLAVEHLMIKAFPDRAEEFRGQRWRVLELNEEEDRLIVQSLFGASHTFKLSDLVTENSGKYSIGATKDGGNGAE